MAGGISRVAVPSDAGTPAVGQVSECFLIPVYLGSSDELTSECNTTIRGNGVLLQLDRDGSARGIGPVDGKRLTSCDVESALASRDADGVVLSCNDSCAKRCDCGGEEAHVEWEECGRV